MIVAPGNPATREQPGVNRAQIIISLSPSRGEGSRMRGVWQFSFNCLPFHHQSIPRAPVQFGRRLALNLQVCPIASILMEPHIPITTIVAMVVSLLWGIYAIISTITGGQRSAFPPHQRIKIAICGVLLIAWTSLKFAVYRLAPDTPQRTTYTLNLLQTLALAIAAGMLLSYFINWIYTPRSLETR